VNLLPLTQRPEYKAIQTRIADVTEY